MNVVTICGSTKFKDQMFDLAKRLTLSGEIVLMPLVFAHKGDQITEEQKIQLDDLHKQKIDLSSAVAVVMVDEYIGESTRNEIEYAKSKNLPITYYNWSAKTNPVEVPGILKLAPDRVIISERTYKDLKTELRRLKDDVKCCEIEEIRPLVRHIGAGKLDASKHLLEHIETIERLLGIK